MNFAQMLSMTSAAIRSPAPQLPPMSTKKSTDEENKRMDHARAARSAKARESYRRAIYGPSKQEQAWYTTADLERKAGKCKGGSYDVLQQLVKEGLLEKRPAGGGAYNRRKGWEYRWIGE